MGWSSTAPAVLASLVTILKASPDLSATTVFDGPQVTGASGYEAITVGYTDDVTPNAVDGTFTDEGLGLSPSRELYTIQSAIWVLNGSANMTAARTRAYELLGIVGNALARDKTLGGTAMFSRLAAVTYTPQQTDSGAVAQIIFALEVDTYTGP